MNTGYETTLSGGPGSPRGNANPAHTDDAAHVVDSAAAADGTLSVGEDTSLSGTEEQAFTGKSARALSLRLFNDNGALTGSGHAIYYVTNSTTPAADLADPTLRRVLPIGKEVLINFSAVNPCTQLDYKSNGATMTNVTLAWEYKE